MPKCLFLRFFGVPSTRPASEIRVKVSASPCFYDKIPPMQKKLDLNLPKKTGREVIQDIKADSSLANIPVVVLTSSSYDQDVLEGLDPKRCLYLVKPSSFQALVDAAKQIHSFWISPTSPPNP